MLEKPEIKLVAAAAVPSERGPLGLRVMDCGQGLFHGQDALHDARPARRRARGGAGDGQEIHGLFQRAAARGVRGARRATHRAGRDRARGAGASGSGRIAARRRAGRTWFWSQEKTGGILCDIGSHHFEQFLYWSGATEREGRPRAGRELSSQGSSRSSRTGAKRTSSPSNGATNYIRIDWLNPDGLRTWGDGRAFILGTEGYIELRKYLDVGRDLEGDQLYLVDHKGEHHIRCHGEVGFPFFGQLILDCLNRTENAMTQEHAFLAAELCLTAQAMAKRIE